MLLFEEGVVRVGVNSHSDPLPKTMQRAWKDQILKSNLGNQPLKQDHRLRTGKMFYKINKAHAHIKTIWNCCCFLETID